MSRVDKAGHLTGQSLVRSVRLFAVLALAATAAVVTLAHPAAAATTKTTYGGLAYGAYLNVPGLIDNVTVVSTGNLPPKGGMLTANGTKVSVPPVLTANLIQCETQGSNEVASSETKITGLGVLPASVSLTAKAVTVMSQAVPTGTFGNTNIEGLMIGGQPVQVTGAPNQVVNLPGIGKLVIDQQIVSHQGTMRRIIVNGLVLTLNDGTDITIAHASSTINTMTAGATLYSGRAYGIFTKVPPIESDHFADTGELPGAGGHRQKSIESVDLNGVVQTGTVTSETQGESDIASSNSKVEGLTLLPGSTSLITADAVSSQTQVTSTAATGLSTIVNLQIAGVPVTVTGAPNQTITIAGVGVLVINEQTIEHNGNFRQIIVNGLHLTLTGGEQVVVAHSESDLEIEQ